MRVFMLRCLESSFLNFSYYTVDVFIFQPLLSKYAAVPFFGFPSCNINGVSENIFEIILVKRKTLEYPSCKYKIEEQFILVYLYIKLWCYIFTDTAN